MPESPTPKPNSDSAENTRRWWTHFHHVEVWNLVVAVLSFVVITATAVIILVQLRDGRYFLEQSRDATSQLLTLQLDERLSDPINTRIVEIVSTEGAKLRKGNGGPITDGQLDNYLGVFEDLNDAYDAHLISYKNFCSMFSSGIQGAASSPEIEAYIREEQKEDPLYDTGFQHLAQIAKKCK